MCIVYGSYNETKLYSNNLKLQEKNMNNIINIINYNNIIKYEIIYHINK